MRSQLNYILKCSISECAGKGLACSTTGGRHQSTFVADAVSPKFLDKAKPFDDIPGPKPLPLLGNIHRYLPIIGEYKKSEWHQAQRMKHVEYGPIVRETIYPGYNIVHLFDPKDMEAVSWNEGKYPKRDFFVAMGKMREEHPEVYSCSGIASSNGESWYNLRTQVQIPMMRPQIMRTYLPQMNLIADDLLRRIRLLQQPNMQVPGLIEELFKWALESVTYILFNERLGCLDDNITEESLSQKYIQAVNDFFKLSAKVELSSFPIWRAYPRLSPSYQKLKKVHDFFFESAMHYVHEQMKTMKQGEGSDDSSQSLMRMMLERCSPKDASVMAVDAMAAGIDTTSLTTAYVLKNLAANPSVQRSLQEEVDRIVPNKQPLTEDTLNQMQYLKACVKESMRICPTVQGTSRTLDKDIVLSGYRIPANTMMTLNYYVSSQQEQYFENASDFKPERWLRGPDNKPLTKESFAFLPFGFGPRMCIGRRIAELEMFTLLTKIMQNFWIENKKDDLDIRFQLVLMISSPLEYEFYERSKLQN